MENVILPIATYFFTLGGTMNMFNYDGYREQARVFGESDIIQVKYQAALNSTYYLLQDDRLPYPSMGLPVDLLLRVKSNRYPQSILYDIPRIVHRNPIHDVVSLVIVTEYTTGKRAVSQSAAPLTGWQESVPKTATHYADELIFGGKCIAMVEVKSNVAGDVQIIRRIFAEAMGTRGHFAKKDTRAFTELWKFAMRAAKESPDVRGHVYVKDFNVQCTNIDLPFEAEYYFEKFLEYLPNISVPYPVKQEKRTVYVSLKPLHSLDERYPKMEKNKKSEKYLTSLDGKIDDLEKVVMDGYLIPRTEENKLIKSKFWKKVNEIRKILNDLSLGEISIYKDIDEENFDNVFKQYQAGLDEGDKNYFSAWKKLLENIEMSCGRKFLKPTSGALVASEDEVAHIRSVKEGLKECRKYCRKEASCRAFGFDKSNPKMCRIYSVSTNTAMIFSPEEDNFMKIYDRQCDRIGG